jgi:hypothetical protein
MITQRDLNFVAKYYDYEGYRKSDIQKEVEHFCVASVPSFNLVQSRQMIKRAMTHMDTNQLRFPHSIDITENELLAIKRLNNYRQEKLVFSMLVCAKFFSEHSSKKKPQAERYSGLYSNQAIRDIIELSGTKISLREWKTMKHEICLLGLISPTIVGGNRFAIGFDDPHSKVMMTIGDYRNPIVYYQKYCGENITFCQICGMLMVKKSHNHVMCSTCYKEKFREINKERRREKYAKKRVSETSLHI